MPYSMTTNAPTGFDLIDRLDALANTYIDAMREYGALSVQKYAPRDRGHLVAWLSQNGREGHGLVARGWVGPLTGLDVDKSAPRGALKRFVRDYLGENAYRPYWDAMSAAEKDALQEGREAGNTAWGGKIINAMYAPRYMAAVDRGIVPAGNSGGVHAQHQGFVQRILDQTTRMAEMLSRNLPTNLAFTVRTDYA